MSNIVLWPLVTGGGVILGIIFYGGLWWTTKKAMSSKSPLLWFTGSLLTRFGTALAGIYFISNQHWERILFCLAGFIIARYLVLRVTQSPGLKTLISKGGEQ